ncbi:hypothetical protein PYV02_01555 [Leifsonia sp. H3M29-4]|uniref:hypothetical protein n=1 Tax=Salinibacterium metalliresistens TaxID=3031321 RepID=UPI0023DA505F|nr:hypothetical protein [Salinibacterium metalliresistens]MDF1477765.1 hypothetical protein [Salinibacterium metalliresistens]
MNRALVPLTTAALGLLLVGCAGLNVPEERGTVIVKVGADENCNPTHHPEIGLGAVVTITDENGEVLQSPRLNAGVPVGPNECVYGFTVRTLPERETYKFEIGSVSKTVTREDLPSTFISLRYP